MPESDPRLTLEDAERYRFIGSKVARTILQASGLPPDFNEGQATALGDTMGTLIASGMILGALGQTTSEDISRETERLQEQLGEKLANTVGRMVPHLIPKGIRFYETDIKPGNSAQVQGWTDEYELLRSIDP